MQLDCGSALPEQDKPLAVDVDAAGMARRTAGFSGAELANLVNEAALAAGKGGHARITAAMLDEAQDKILMGSERRWGGQSLFWRERGIYAGGALVVDCHPCTLITACWRLD